MKDKAYRDFQEAVYGSFSYTELAPRSYDYTAADITAMQAELLCLRWTKEMDATLLTFYPKMGSRCVEFIPGVSCVDVCRRAHELGVKTEGYFWTEEEASILEEYYPEFGKATLELLPNRTYGALRVKAARAGLTRV